MATTVSTVLSYCEQKTQAGTGNLNGSNGINFLNEAQDEFRSTLIDRGVDAAQTQESYTNGSYATAAGDNYSTFSFPSDMYALKTIEINMTDSNSQNYLQAQQLDAANTPGGTSFSWLRANQSTSMPLVDVRGDTYEIFPSFFSATNTTNAIRIIYFLAPTQYATTGDSLSYPDSVNWQILAKRVCGLYYESLNKFTEADYWNNQYKQDVEKLTETLAKGSQQPIQAQPLALTGFEF